MFVHPDSPRHVAPAVSQRHLHSLVGQIADGIVAQGGDPAETRVLPQALELGVGKHPAVADDTPKLPAWPNTCSAGI